MALQEPLHFAPLFVSKVWGGRTLERYLGPIAAKGPIGEVWELVDRDGCSSVVEGGTFAGRSLRGLMLSETESLLGATRPAPGGTFPLLVKLLDATQDLSVQVHPDRKVARRIGGGATGKTEAWFILSAAPGSILHLGLKPGVDAKSFAAKAARPGVVDLLQTYEVKAGQFVFVPPGTVHSIGRGIALVEIQENSDTTYRLFDWGRAGMDGKPRELHTEQALCSMEYDQQLAGPIESLVGGKPVDRVRLADCDAFAIDLLRLHGSETGDTDGRALVYVVVEGSGVLATSGGVERRIGRGETWLLPAAVGEHRFASVEGELRVLRVETKAGRGE